MSETMLRKHLCIPFLQTGTTTGETPAPIWRRIDKSTIFALNPNPQSEQQDYICYETPVTVVDHYEPELPQEIAMNEGNPMYDFIFEKFYNLPTGEECKVPCLICFPTASTTAANRKAWLVNDCVLVLGEMNPVDKKISFTLNLGGDIQKGYYTITDGAPTFSLTPPTSGSGGST